MKVKEMQHSQAISDFINNHPNHFRKIKKLAIHDAGRSSFRACQRFYHSMKGHITCPDMVYGTSRKTLKTLVFIGNEQAIMEKLNAMEFKSVPAPPSVVVKMIALRLKKLDKTIEKRNNEITRNNNSINTNGWSEKAKKLHLMPLIDRLEFSDIDDIKQGKGKWWSVSCSFRNACELMDLKRVLNRENVTPDVVKQAWGLYEVDAVMRS